MAINKTLFLLFTFAILAFNTGAYAASFDCKDARGKSELAICSDAELGRLDDELNNIYLTLRQNPSRSEFLVSSQREWLKIARGCKSIQCIKSSYKARIKELSSFDLMNESEWGELTKKSKPENICQVIADLANLDQLHKYVFSEGKNIKYENRNIDLVFTTEGTAHFPYVYGYDSKTRKPLESFEMPTIPGPEQLWGGDNFGLFVYKNHKQILYYKDFKYPISTISLDDGSGCGFSSVFEEIIGPDAAEPELCTQIKEGIAFDQYEFKEEVWMTQEDVSKRYSETRITNTRLLEFANDGKAERVARLQLDSGAGAGCGESFFDLLDRNGTRFESGQKRDLLLKLQGAAPDNRYPLKCDNQPKFFEFKNQIYFENKPSTWPPENSWNEYHRVATVHKNEVVDVCNFQFKSTVTSE